MKPKPWSYSALTSYETCPKRHYLTRATKLVKEPESAAIQHGVRCHAIIEKHLRDGMIIPKSERYGPLVAMLTPTDTDEVMVEKQVALNKNLDETDWFSAGVWVRCVYDYAYIRGDRAWVYDWKTGKAKPDDDQLRLFAASMFAIRPHVNAVKAAFVWLANFPDKKPVLSVSEYRREDAADIWNGFTPRVQALDNAYILDRWPARPSGLCRNWCPVGRNHCDHCGV